MSYELMQPLIATILISGLSFSGSILLINRKLVSKNILHYLVSFAAGVMLSTALLDILPEALESQDDLMAIMWTVLFGIIFGFMMERFVLWYHHHHEDSHNIKPSAYLVIFGDAFHNFIDGIAIAATFIANPGVGIATTIAIAAHEIPQEIADLSILINSGLTKKKALLFNGLSALTAVIGVIIGFYFIKTFDSVTNLMLGFTAGIFLYIPLADLIPELHSDYRSQKNWRSAVTFLAGILLLYLLTTFLHEGSVANGH